MTGVCAVEDARVRVDRETYDALAEHAEAQGEPVTTTARDILRAYLTRKGFTFITVPARYNRKGHGRAVK
jgi:hypothetical protein